MVHALPDVVLAGTAKQQLTATAQRAAWVQIFSKTGNTAGKVGGAEVTSTQGAPIVASTGNNTPLYLPPCGNTDTYELSAIYILGTTSDVYYVIYGTI